MALTYPLICAWTTEVPLSATTTARIFQFRWIEERVLGNVKFDRRLRYRNGLIPSETAGLISIRPGPDQVA